MVYLFETHYVTDPDLKSMEDMKFGICRVNDPVNSSTFGIVYRKACVLEFRYKKSTQNLDIVEPCQRLSKGQGGWHLSVFH
jgi:hypothetical protein